MTLADCKTVSRVLLLSIVLTVFGGCQPAEKPFQSALAGSWYSVAATEAWLTGEGVLEKKYSLTQPAAGRPVRELVARIRADGTFDWSHTKLQNYGDTLLLRKTGDQVTHPTNPNLTTTVVWADYDQVSSRAMLEVARTSDQGNRASVLFYFGAALQPDGTVDYWHGTFPPDRVGVTAYDLDRGPALGQGREMAAMIRQGVQQLEGAKDPEAGNETATSAPASDEMKAAPKVEDAPAASEEAKVSTEGPASPVVEKAGGAKYRLFAPQQKEGMSLVVVLQGEPLGEKTDPDSELWADLAAKHGCAVLLTELASVAEGRTPNSAEVAEDVVQVKASISAARRSVNVGSVYLLSVSAGGLVGHMIWQWDNGAFAGYLAWNSVFRSWFGEAGEAVDLDKPVALWSEAKVGAGADVAQEWYSAQGFTHVDRQTVELDDGDGGAAGADEKLVAHLLGLGQ